MTKTKPKKKHLGSRDPYKQIAERHKKIKDKINNPPKDIDEQEIPKSVRAIMNFMKMSKSKVEEKKKSPKPTKNSKQRNNNELFNTADFCTPIGEFEDCPKVGRPVNPPMKIKQKTKESFYSYMKRVNTATQNLIEESKFEEKNKLEIRKNAKGEMIDLVPYKHIDELMSAEDRKLKEKRKRKKLLRVQERKRLRDQFNAEKKEDLVFKKREKQFLQKERIKFGDIVHAPPQPRAASPIKQKPYRLKDKKLEMERVKIIQRYRRLKALQVHQKE